MPHIRFNWVDILFVTLLIRISYVGFKNGLLPEFLRLLGLFSAFIVSFNNYTSLSNFLLSHTKWTEANLDGISFLFLFLVVLFVFKILAILARGFLGGDNISGLNRGIGLTFGIARGLLLVSFIYILFVNSPFGYLRRSAEERSFSGRYVSNIPRVIYKKGINLYPGEKVDTPLVKRLEEEE